MASYSGPPKVGDVRVVDKEELSILKQNAGMVLGFTIVRVAEAVGACVIDGLAESQPRVPWDTGELRRSGRAYVKVGTNGRTFAKGNKSGTVGILRQGDPLRFWGWNSMIRSVKTNPRIEGRITYNRVKNGRDIALWTHENLNPHDTRPNPPAARKPGTGPKYLEITVNERKQQWIMAIFNSARNVPFEIKDISEIKKGKGKWSVDRVKLVKRRVKRKGYFGR